MKNSQVNQFYSEGFTFQVQRKLTRLFSNSKTRTFAVKPPVFPTWEDIAEAVNKAGFEDLELKDFEFLSKKDVWKAAYIVAIAYSPFGIFRPFFAVYFYSHIDAETLGKLSYTVRLLNDTNATLHMLVHPNGYIYAGISQLEKDALLRAWMK